MPSVISLPNTSNSLLKITKIAEEETVIYDDNGRHTTNKIFTTIYMVAYCVVILTLYLILKRVSANLTRFQRFFLVYMPGLVLMGACILYLLLSGKIG